MSSLLRCTKFVQYFTAARTLILTSGKSAESSLLFNLNSLGTANNVLLRDYATSKQSTLQKLDADLRRVGRISKKDIDKIFEEIKSKNDITSSQSLLVIRCCGELAQEELPKERTLLVQKIWNALTERGIPMDISHYNALLKVYIENEHPFSPTQFLEELEKKGLQPNRVTYQRLMWRYCQEGDIESATTVLEKMRELNMAISEPILNALVMGHAFHGDIDGAKLVLETMSSSSLEPTNTTYTLLACGYAKNGDMEGIEKTISNAKQKEEVFTDKNILDVAEHLAVNGHGDKIDQLFQHLEKNKGFNQDVCNAILRLLNKGQEEAAKKILKIMHESSSPSANTFYKGAFFIKKLVSLDTPYNDIIKMCRELKEEGLIPNAFYFATEAALVNGQTELAQKLFSELKSEGIEIREHYYWPLLVQKAIEDDEEGLLQILRNMAVNGVPVTGETIRKYVIPYLIKKDTPENTILKLQIASIPVIVSAGSIIIKLLDDNNIKKAAELVAQYNPEGNFGFVADALVNALGRTRDVNSFLSILQIIIRRGSGQNLVENEPTQEDNFDKNSIINNVSRIVVVSVKKLSKPDLCETLLKAIYSKGLRINTEAAQAIEQHFGDDMTTNLSLLLSKLTSSDLDMTLVQDSRTTLKSSAELEAQLTFLQNKGIQKVGRVQEQLIFAYVKENNVNKLNSHLEELKNSGFKLTPTTLARLFEFYCDNDDIEKARECQAQIKEKSPTFLLNNRPVHMAHALLKANRVDEAIQYLKDNKPDKLFEISNYKIASKCWQMLNTLAEQNNVEKVLELTNVLIDNNYIEPSNVLLGPAIKVNLLTGDIENALKIFEQFSRQYRCTPWKGELMKALIKKEDATKLQWVADLSTEIYGEVNSLHDLVLAFVECGRLRQARRILETLGPQTPRNRLEKSCQRYVEEGKIECLEGLLEATKDLSHIDRGNIYYHLLVAYCNNDNTDKALALWTLLQEEGEIPTDQFLQHLGKHLKSKNRPMPFVIQDEKTPQQDSVMDNNPSMKENISNEIKTMLDNGQLSRAAEVSMKSIEHGDTPRHNVLKYLLKLLAEAGEVEKIKQFGNIINKRLSRHLSYSSKLTLALFVKGSGPQHIDNLLNTVQTAKTDVDLENALINFPVSTALELIMKDEDLIDKCTKIANIAAEKGKILPVNLLWMELLLCGKDKEANELWTKWLNKTPTILFMRLLRESNTRKEPQLMENLIALLKTNTNVSKVAIGNVYSKLINYYLLENKVEEAEQKFRDAQKSGLTTLDIGNTTLTRLKSAIQETGREFNMAI